MIVPETAHGPGLATRPFAERRATSAGSILAHLERAKRSWMLRRHAQSSSEVTRHSHNPRRYFEQRPRLPHVKSQAVILSKPIRARAPSPSRQRIGNLLLGRWRVGNDSLE